MAISLANIRKGRGLKPPKGVIYGPGGVGKTTWAANAPDPVFLMTEEGEGLLDLPAFEVREGDPLLRSWDELIECIGFLVEGDHDRKTVVLDSADAAEALLHKSVCEAWGQPSIDSNGGEFGYGRGYIAALDEARVLLRGLDACRQRGMAIIVVAHSETKPFHDPMAESYDTYTIRLHKSFAAALHDWSDFVVFANWKAHVVHDDSDGKRAVSKDAQKRRRAVGTGDRVLYTEKRPAFMAKNRYSLPAELPLEWQAFEEAIAASAKALTSTPSNKEK